MDHFGQADREGAAALGELVGGCRRVGGARALRPLHGLLRLGQLLREHVVSGHSRPPEIEDTVGRGRQVANQRPMLDDAVIRSQPQAFERHVFPEPADDDGRGRQTALRRLLRNEAQDSAPSCASRISAARSGLLKIQSAPSSKRGAHVTATSGAVVRNTLVATWTLLRSCAMNRIFMLLHDAVGKTVSVVYRPRLVGTAVLHYRSSTDVYG